MRAAVEGFAGVWAVIGQRSYSDIVLAFGVVTIIALMVLPLPLVLIDILVAVNILCGVGLLLLAIYVPAPVAFSSFPSVVLLTTLFRLALSIAITRLILIDADAGHIIETFGELVAGGNLVVGLVVFMIITVVQFIVVAKGAGRVAEVAARFSLDAMPGKQLSIDSDLRSGLTTKDEARQKRRSLELESQFHGSLDGAMKFVKGDAIAGIVIIIINILAGLAIGVLQRDMPLGDAMRTYSILTIGDGLVAQIPALLTAIAAGLLVTRTASDDQDAHLGTAIARQISAHPRVFLVGGLLSMLFATVPGFPWLVFLVLGLALLAGFAWQSRNQLGSLRRMLDPDAPEPQPDAETLLEYEELLPPPPMLLALEARGLETLSRARVLIAIGTEIERIREEYGVPVPAPVLRAVDDLAPAGYRLEAHGIGLAAGALRTEEYFRLTHAPAAPEARGEFLPEIVGEWSRAQGGENLHGPCALPALHAGMGIRRHLAVFLGIQETSNLNNRWSQDYPDLTKEMLRVAPPHRISEVLRRLVKEGIPIRNLRDIFEAITDAGGREKDIALLGELVRLALRRQISDRFAGRERTLRSLLAHPELEDTLRQSVRDTPEGQAAIDPDVLGRTLQQIRDVRARLGQDFEGVVLLCSMDIRRHLRRFTENEFFDLGVLSFQELSGDIKVRPVGQIGG